MIMGFDNRGGQTAAKLKRRKESKEEIVIFSVVELSLNVSSLEETGTLGEAAQIAVLNIAGRAELVRFFTNESALREMSDLSCG